MIMQPLTLAGHVDLRDLLASPELLSDVAYAAAIGHRLTALDCLVGCLVQSEWVLPATSAASGCRDELPWIAGLVACMLL